MRLIFTSKGAVYVADSIARLYKTHFFRRNKLFELVKLKKIKPNFTLVVLGLYCHHPDSWLMYQTLSFYFKKTIVIFAGTDILQLKNSQDKNNILKSLLKRKAKFAGVGDKCAEEASKLFNLDVGTIYLPCHHPIMDKVIPYPSKFSIGCYMPPSRGSFYGFEKITEAARNTPEINYYYYSLQGASLDLYKEWAQEGVVSVPKDIPKNIKFVDRPITSAYMPKFLEKISCGLRITEHDGYPMSIAEYNITKRHFIYNQNWPYCIYYNNSGIDELVSVIKQAKVDCKKPNTKGFRFYKNRHSKETFIKLLESIESE